jgi:antirestriction protein ArdC
MSIYKQITNSIIEQLEAGVAPWVKPWATLPGEGTPKNLHTGKAYRGVNVLQLWAAAEIKKYEHPMWCTYKQAQERGGQVRKGEKGTTVVFWKPMEKVDPDTGNIKKTLLARGYTVFNIAQIDGIEAVMPTLPQHEWNPLVEAESLVHKHGIDLRIGGDRAYFNVNDDYIGMPDRTRFEDAENYYSTLLHEITHWSGHKTRLDRPFNGFFGSPDYAREELVAELGSAFLCARLGINGELQHPEYIASWIQVLKDDSTAIVRASKLAEIAADYVMEVQHGSSTGTQDGGELAGESDSSEQSGTRLAA